MSFEESGLLEAARKGDVEAFEALINPLKDRLFRLVLSILGNPDDAEDALQDALVQAFRSIHSFRSDSSLLTWLYRITLNTARNAARGISRSASTVLEPAMIESAVGCTPGPEEKVAADTDRRLIREAISKLPEHYRDVLVLKYYNDLNYEEIADVLRIPVGTVRSRLNQARLTMVRHLKSVGFSQEEIIR